MATVTFKTQDFEGPLDLLLTLIAKHKYNIYDIPIFELVEQYQGVIENAKEMDMELASEFLEMAARLINIKSASLLPKPEEAERLKDELTGELVEYHLCKLAAGNLEKSFRGEVVFARSVSEIELDYEYHKNHMPTELLSAMDVVVVKAARKAAPKAESFYPIVERKIVSVASRIAFLLRNLVSKRIKKYDEIFDKSKDRPEMVATFLAVLELVKEGRVQISENDEIKVVEK